MPSQRRKLGGGDGQPELCKGRGSESDFLLLPSCVSWLFTAPSCGAVVKPFERLSFLQKQVSSLGQTRGSSSSCFLGPCEVYPVQDALG